MDIKHNRYYVHFRNSLGYGLQAEPDFGQFYSYKSGLQRGRGQLFLRRRGLGFASFFTSLFQKASPLLKSFGSKAVDVVSNIAKDALQGENIKDSAAKNITQAISSAFTNNSTKEVNKPILQNPPKRKRIGPVISSSVPKKKFKSEYSKFTTLKKLS